MTIPADWGTRLTQMVVLHASVKVTFFCENTNIAITNTNIVITVTVTSAEITSSASSSGRSTSSNLNPTISASYMEEKDEYKKPTT